MDGLHLPGCTSKLLNLASFAVPVAVTICITMYSALCCRPLLPMRPGSLRRWIQLSPLVSRPARPVFFRRPYCLYVVSKASASFITSLSVLPNFALPHIGTASVRTLQRMVRRTVMLAFAFGRQIVHLPWHVRK